MYHRRCAADDRFRTFGEVFGTASDTKYAGVVLTRGDRVLIRTAGGGGFGDPARRDPELLRADVAEGLVTREYARRGYGVETTSRGVDR